MMFSSITGKLLKRLSIISLSIAAILPNCGNAGAAAISAGTIPCLSALQAMLEARGCANFQDLIIPPVAISTPGQEYVAKQILQQPPFAPKDVNMFSPLTYSNATPLQPAPPRTFTDCQLRAQVLATLAVRFRADLNRIRQGYAVYDDPLVAAVMPDARIRAALAMLKGTAADASIAAIKSGVFSKVEFGAPLGGDTLEAESFPDGAKQKIILNAVYQYENPKLWSAVLSHEVLHEDAPDTNKEELIANTVDALIYAQLINEDPAVARSGTELTRRLNTKLMALINSRDATGRIRILASSTDNVYPGSNNPLPYFGFGFVQNGLGADTPGNPTLSSDLSAITRKNIVNANFDLPTLHTLDENIKLFCASQWVRLANILKLDTGT